MNKAEVEKKDVTLVSQDMFSNWFLRALLAALSSVKFGGDCNFEVKCLLRVKLLKFIEGSCEFYTGQ
jgi:hypothetical protein